MMEAHALEPAKHFTEARDKYDELESLLSADATRRMTHGEVEGLLESEGRELLRLLFQGHLDLRRAGEDTAVTVVAADGQQMTHRRVRARRLLGVFGLVNVARCAFGAQGKKSLMPLDAELNMPACRYSDGLQRRVVEEVVRGSYDDAIEAVSRTIGVSVPKRQAEQIAQGAAVDFDEFYRAEYAPEAPPKEHMLVLTVDGKGIVMRPEALREETRKRAHSSKLKKRLSKGEKRNRRRMATVASVYSISPHVRTPQDIIRELRPVRDVEVPKAPRPLNKRVWASVAKEVEEVVAEMFEEALRRDPGRSMRWVAVVDGNKQQLGLLKKYAKRHGVELTIVVDVIHVLEYLWKATTIVHGEGKPETERIVGERFLKVLQGRATHVAAGISQSASKRKLPGWRRTLLRRASDYLLNVADFANYDSYLADGLPIASGVIEGACRYLVKDRMDITGARWGLEADAVLRLRALKASGDMDAYWRFHQRQEWHRNHASRYLDESPPSTTTVPWPRPRLTLVDGGS